MNAPSPNARSLVRTTSMPITSAAVSSWWIESMLRPRLERSSREKTNSSTRMMPITYSSVNGL